MADHPGFPGYQVSEGGRVRNARGKLLTADFNSRGYPCFLLFDPARRRRRVKAAKAVCLAWYGPKPSPMHEVRHLDDDKMNSRPGNLCWGTKKENLDDRRRLGNAGLKLTPAQVRTIYCRAHAGERQASIAKDFGIHHSTVSGIKRGSMWSYLNLSKRRIPKWQALTKSFSSGTLAGIPN